MLPFPPPPQKKNLVKLMATMLLAFFNVKNNLNILKIKKKKKVKTGCANIDKRLFNKFSFNNSNRNPLITFFFVNYYTILTCLRVRLAT